MTKNLCDVDVDLTKVDVQVDDEHTNKIQVNDRSKFVNEISTINSVGLKDYTKGVKQKA